MSDQYIVKIVHGGTARRFPLPATATWDDLAGQVGRLFPDAVKDVSQVQLGYVDEDGDAIVFSSDLELQEALLQSATGVDRRAVRFTLHNTVSEGRRVAAAVEDAWVVTTDASPDHSDVEQEVEPATESDADDDADDVDDDDDSYKSEVEPVEEDVDADTEQAEQVAEAVVDEVATPSIDPTVVHDEEQEVLADSTAVNVTVVEPPTTDHTAYEVEAAEEQAAEAADATKDAGATPEASEAKEEEEEDDDEDDALFGLVAELLSAFFAPSASSSSASTGGPSVESAPQPTPAPRSACPFRTAAAATAEPVYRYRYCTAPRAPTAVPFAYYQHPLARPQPQPHPVCYRRYYRPDVQRTHHPCYARYQHPFAVTTPTGHASWADLFAPTLAAPNRHFVYTTTARSAEQPAAKTTAATARPTAAAAAAATSARAQQPLLERRTTAPTLAQAPTVDDVIDEEIEVETRSI